MVSLHKLTFLLAAEPAVQTDTLLKQRLARPALPDHQIHLGKNLFVLHSPSRVSASLPAFPSRADRREPHPCAECAHGAWLRGRVFL